MKPFSSQVYLVSYFPIFATLQSPQLKICVILFDTTMCSHILSPFNNTFTYFLILFLFPLLVHTTLPFILKLTVVI